MKRFYKIILCIGLFSVGLLSPSPARADMFGASDSALLTQQILQWFQDFTQRTDQYELLWDGFEKTQEKLDKVRDISETAGKIGGTAAKTAKYARKITILTRSMINTSKLFFDDYNYIRLHGSEEDIYHCYRAYVTYNSMASSLISNMVDVLRNIKDLYDNPADAEKELDKKFDKAARVLDGLSYDTGGFLSSLCFKTMENEHRNDSTSVGSSSGVVNPPKSKRVLAI